MFSVIGNRDMQILLGVSFVSVFTAVLFESNKISVLLTHPIKGWNRILELPDCLWVQLGPSHQVVQVVYCTTPGCHLHCSPCKFYCWRLCSARRRCNNLWVTWYKYWDLIIKSPPKGSSGLGGPLSFLKIGKCKWQALFMVCLGLWASIKCTLNFWKSNYLDLKEN